MGMVLSGGLAVWHPDSPLPDEWNPAKPLHVTDELTPLTQWKLARTAGDGAACLAALEGAARISTQPDREVSASCHIRDRVTMSGVGGAAIDPIETRCAIALRTAMWERHALQPAARDLLGTDLTRISHVGSYNCRQMRTSSGNSGRWSTHATADAIDVIGFSFADGTRLRLLSDWDDAGGRGAYLKAARDSACNWFRVTLSPDHNRLHADHFHLQSAGWGLCR